MKLSMILARSMDNVIGINNELPWKCPADLVNFKDITKGKAIAMGRKTWESLPKKPLPNRMNIVITANPQNLATECMDGVACVSPSITDAVEWCKLHGVEELIFIGGKAIYEEAVKIVDEVYLTEMNWCTLSDNNTTPEDQKVYFDYNFETYTHHDTVIPPWEVKESWPCLDGETGNELFEFFHLKRK